MQINTKKLLAHPLTRSLDIDDPKTTELRREIIKSKPFLKKIYLDWYSRIASHFSEGEKVLELGSGAGFLHELMPSLITSDVFSVPGVDRIEDARNLSFPSESLDGIVMTNVFHHIPEVESFLREAERTLKPNGRLVMIEPWNTGWSRFIYQNLHHEPFVPTSINWDFKGEGPLSDANGALPWIVFQRDKDVFDKRYNGLRIVRIQPLMPFSYLLSGGVSMRSILPAWTYSMIRIFEKLAYESKTGMFAEVIVERIR